MHCLQQISEAYLCIKCKKFVHAICGDLPPNSEEGYDSAVMCLLCIVETNILSEQTESHKGMQRSADKMLQKSDAKFQAIDLETSVLIPVPKVDRGITIIIIT